MSPSSDRLEQIADMYAKHDDELHRLVRSRQFGHGHISPLVVDDACSFAWTQLLTHDYVNLGPPRWRALAWLRTCAVHEAWRLHRIEYRAAPIVNATVDAITAERDTGAPSAAELAEQHARLELVKQIPERPRRFLLRLALGLHLRRDRRRRGRQLHHRQQADRARQAAPAQPRTSRRGTNRMTAAARPHPTAAGRRHV